MPDEKNAVEEFLGDIKGDDTNPFNDQKSEDGDLGKGEKPKEEEENLPFHKDPKVQKFIEKEITKRIGDQPREIIREVIKDSPSSGVEESELISVMTRIVGNDTPEKVAALKDFEKAWTKSIEKAEERSAERVREEMEQAEEAEHEAEVDAQNELAEGFDNIENEFNVDLTSSKPSAKQLRSDFVDFIKLVSPKDGEGNVVEYPDLQATFRIFQERQKPESNNRAKELSSRSMTRSRDASVTPQPKDNSWNAVDRMFSKLGL